MESLWQDVRFALRTLRKNLPVTLLAIGSLALAIAGNTAVYSLVSSFLSRPIPYHEVDRLVLIGEHDDPLQAGQLSATSPANYLDFAERQRSFQQMGAFRPTAVTLGSGDEGEVDQLIVGEVTPGFLPLFGNEPQWGRFFLDEEGLRGGDHVVLLSYDFWTERFGSRTDLKGETLDLNGEVYDVVGVLAEDFEWLLSPQTDIWVPLVLERDALRQSRSLFAIARLADDVSEATAQAEMDALMAQLASEHPQVNRGFSVELLNLRYDIPDSRSRLFFRLMQLALVFVLLIACSNIANLLLARSQARERELAIRSSMGASRWRIVFQLFTESAVMALAAGVLGIALGSGGMKLIQNAFAQLLPTFWMPSLDYRVLAYSLGITFLGGLLFGLAPVLQTARFDLQSSLKDGSQSTSSGGRRRLTSNILVTVEIALALAFLAGASILIKSFQTMQSVDPGFDTGNILTLRLDLPARYAEPQQKADAVEQISTHLAALPGVRSALISNVPPRVPVLPRESFEIAGRPVADDQALPQAGWLSIQHGFIEALGISLERGRTFSATDNLAAQPVAMINATMARRSWPDENPLGQRITIQGKPREIVGVVTDVAHDVIVRTEASALVYLPWAQQPETAFNVSLKTDVEPTSVAEAVRRAITGLDRSIALTQVQSLEAFVEQFWVGQQVFTAILGSFGTLALVL
ncbi:MAG: ABC transporter permease, partial [Acidobacteriota bacterium]